MVWFWGLLVLVVILLLCTWILVFFVDFRSCANVVCTSDVTGKQGEPGPDAEPAPENDAGPFGPFSIVPGPKGKRGASKKGATGAPSVGGTITGPPGDTGATSSPRNFYNGIFFVDPGLTTLSTSDGLITSSILLNYYEEATVKCPLNFMTDGTEFPTATLRFVRFGKQVTMSVIIGDVHPDLLFNNKKIDTGRGNVQPNYIQFSTAVLNNVSRFFVVRNTPWQIKQPVQILLSSSLETEEAGAEHLEAQFIQPGQFLIRSQTAQILMQLYANPSQGRFCTVHVSPFPQSFSFFGLFGLKASFYVSWNLLL
jgi:hypothetical protein